MVSDTHNSVSPMAFPITATVLWWCMSARSALNPNNSACADGLLGVRLLTDMGFTKRLLQIIHPKFSNPTNCVRRQAA